MKLSKKIRGAVTAVAVVGILGGAGTFAWTSISQRALNEGTHTVKPGGRVHDDYEGFENILGSTGGTVNKDIFAENYSNKRIFARIKLTEYMELGAGAGEYDVKAPDNIMTPKETNHAKVLAEAGLDNAKLADRSTWPAYLPDNTSAIRDYIKWTLGDTNEDRKIYMPTFNQNNENLESDVTGKAIEELTWTLNGNYDLEQNSLPGTHNQWELGEKHVSDLKKNDTTTNTEVVTKDVEHTAVETLAPDQTDGYMTMSQWKVANKPTGNFWIHDADGWIYWANPIEANAATSLLLDKFDVTFPQEDMYYAINVISDFATEDELNKWDGVSSDATDLLALFK